jgi:glutathione S-transferase
MANVYLHHYPASPFSEKIRALLGVLDLEWYSVETSIIMPRPLLMPLSGGYRRIPVAQIGADVYCDSKIIARALAEHAGDDTLYAPGFAATRVADLADTELFRIMAALSFRPQAIAGLLQKGAGGGRGGGGFGGVSIQDFAKDRAEYDGGANLAGMPIDEADGALLHWLTELEMSVTSGFLFGEKPSIADFSVYHPLWFLRNNPVNAPMIEAHPHVMGWLDRMQAFGQRGRVTASDGEAALAEAKASEPRALEPLAIGVDSKPGDRVRITPTDVARVPVEGELVRADAQEFAVRRTTAETGAVIAHFPRTGFALDPVVAEEKK